MTATMRKSLAVILVIAMILALLPFAMVHVFAENNTAEQAETPVLNETIVGEVSFQSFNNLGDSDKGIDGIDYNTTFYYTDDYFAKSAKNEVAENSETRTLNWTDLEDLSMATTSMDFAVASYSSNIGNVDRTIGTQSWNSTDYSNKDCNAISFLEQCGFDNIETFNYDQAPGPDTIAYVLATKEITVFDADEGENKDFHLVAVGIRGAGYGAEWSSNVTIGDSNDPENISRHKGFNDSADTVCDAIDQYIKANGLSDDLKYWVVGYSRSAAVANLTAGNLTDRSDYYHTTQDDVYGYTFEAPQGADKNADDASKYTNIHNIINAMDAVPKVSPVEFDHIRLGYDYLMPYYRNAGSKNEDYYNQMREVLLSIVNDDDLLVNATRNFPYNKPVPIYTISMLQLIDDAGAGTLKDTFGTVKATTDKGPWNNRNRGYVKNILGNEQMYLDTYIDSLIDVFLTSNSWDRNYSDKTTDVMTHRTRFVRSYQDDFRTLFTYFLDFSGPAFMGLIDQIFKSVESRIGSINPGNVIGNAGFALAFVTFYNTSSNTAKENFISASQDMAVEIANDLTKNYTRTPNGITRSQMNTALRNVVALLVDLYAVEKAEPLESQYFGTTLHWLNEILSTHEQETVLSWNMSVDDNHINRGYRTLTVPKDANVTMHVFRDGIDPELSATANGPVIAEYEDGKLSSLDQRIYYSLDDSNVTIRYPASLNIRADVTADKDIANFTYSVRDYQTNTATQGVSDGPNQYKALTNAANYTEITNKTGKTNAKSVNENAVTSELTEENALQIMVHASTTFDNHAAGDANVYKVKNSPRYKITFKDDDDTVLDEQRVIKGMMPVYQGEEPVKEETMTHQYEFAGWDTEIVAASDDAVYTAQYDEVEKLLTGHSLSLEGNIAVNFYYHIPDRYDGDLSIAFACKNLNDQGTLEKVSTGYYNYRASYAVAAREMTEPITATLTCNGEIIDSHSYTVKRYADLAIANASIYGKKLEALSKSMVNYGAYAQKLFGYRLDDLADANLADYSMVSTDDLVAPDVKKDDIDPKISPYGLNYYGLSLVLESETTLKIYFEKKADYDSSVKVYVNGQATSFKEEKVSGSNKEYLSVSIPNIAANQIGNTFTIKIGDASFKVSPLNYVEDALNYNNEDLKNLVKALYDYYKTAKTYFS